MNSRVCAVVVTFNRKELLGECLAGLRAQTRPVDGILVVDNASTDGTPEFLRGQIQRESGLEMLELPENIGGAGGFHEGMKRAYAQGYDWLWVMDDDGIPAPDCLQLLMEQARPGAVMIPVQQGTHDLHGILGWQDGQYVDLNVRTLVPLNGPRAGGAAAVKDLLFTFVGPLISREIVGKVGLPQRDFFIWFDDFEYAFRIKRFTRAPFIVVSEARFRHQPAIEYRQVRLLGIGKPKMRRTFAVWRNYYMARNAFYTLLRTRRRWRDTLLFLALQLRALSAVLLYDPDRWPRAKMQLRGLLDGALGRMGRRH